jgi:quinol monooxygenase YgiN
MKYYVSTRVGYMQHLQQYRRQAPSTIDSECCLNVLLISHAACAVSFRLDSGLLKLSRMPLRTRNTCDSTRLRAFEVFTNADAHTQHLRAAGAATTTYLIMHAA